jgi:peptidoglycan/LPS O-acetylase OafA/YrhL
VRRLARIVPAYWVALTVWLVVVRDPLPPRAGDDPLLLLYGFGQVYRAGYVDGRGALSVAWTLCIELTFYVVLPPLAWLLCRLARRGPAARQVRVLVAACAGLAVGGSLLRWWLLSQPSRPTNYPLVAYWLPGHIGWFAAGMAVAAMSAGAAAGVRPPRWVRDLARVPPVAIAAAVGVFWLTTLLPVRKPIQTADELLLIFVANGLASTVLLVPFVIGDQATGAVRRALASRPARWLGEVSYGLYLWHTIVLYQVNHWVRADDLPGSAPVRLAVVLAVSLALAQASWTLVERPVLRLAARVGTAR